MRVALNLSSASVVLACVSTSRAVAKVSPPPSAADDSQDRRRHRIAALMALGPAGVAAAIALQMPASNASWIPAWGAIAVVYVALSVVLWQRRQFARSMALGVCIAGLITSVQGLIVAGGEPILVWGAVGHVLWNTALLRTRANLERRHEAALACAGAAVPCAVMFGLAPQQEPITTLGVLVGAALVVGSVTGLAKGKTWGLLIAPLASAAVIASVGFATRYGHLSAPHPMLPENPIALSALGVSAALLSGMSFGFYLRPLIRFLKEK